jgi:hypothetical protein
MNNSSDIIQYLGIGLVVAALGGGIYVFMDDRAAGGGGDEKAKSNKATSSAGSKTDKGTNNGANGWVPSSAKEVAEHSSFPTSAKASNGCREVINPIEIAKGIVTKFESRLREATKLSDQQESELGDMFEKHLTESKDLRGKLDLPDDLQRYRPYLQALIDRLVRHQTRKGIRYRVHIIRDDKFNAFAMPGGVMLVHTGTLNGPNAVRSEAELVAILGHEIAHVEKRHVAAKFQYAQALLGKGQHTMKYMAFMLKNPIGSEYEHEADLRGQELAAAAQYNPMAAVDLWRRKAGKRKSTKNPIDSLVGSLLQSAFSTHPPDSTRCFRSLKNAVAIIKKSKFKRFYNGKSNLKALKPGFVKAF